MTEQTDREDAAQDDRLAEIKRAMGDGSYFADPNMQAEYLRLAAAQRARTPPAQ
jgi:anti-sigma28 factor (negative regulator of flagellin synthesis)